MSVKVVDRNESKVQYVTTAVELQKKTIFVLTRMSNKMQGFFKEDLMWLALSVCLNWSGNDLLIYLTLKIPNIKDKDNLIEQKI